MKRPSALAALFAAVRRRSVVRIVAVAVLALAPSAAFADMLNFNFDPVNTFSGTAPSGTLTAQFTDLAGGDVQLVLSSSLAAGENLDPGKAWYFNFDPSKDARNLSFTLTGNTNFGEAAVVLTTNNPKDPAFKADGDGHYDILFTYSSSTKAFVSGESQTYTIHSSAGAITVNDFDFYSQFTSGHGSWLAAVHVQNTPSGGSGSGWVAGTQGSNPVPEPAALALALSGVGLIGLGGVRRLLRRKA